LLLNKFFPIVDTCLSCEDIARQSCAMVPGWRFLATFLRPAFSATRMQHVSDLHPKRTKATPCVEVWQTSNLQRLRLGEEKKKLERKKKKPQDETSGYAMVVHGRPKTPRNRSFLGVTQPPGVAQPLYSTGHT